jgi:hypothetical protein
MSLTAVTPYNQTNNNIFDPRLVSGLALWLDATDTSTVVTSGSNVTAWNDKSGNGRNMVANVSFQRPIYSPNSLNGNNSILFFRNASNSFTILENTSFNFTTSSWTYFTVLRRNAANTTFQRFLSMASVINGKDNNNSFSVNLNSSSPNNFFNMERNGSLAGTFNTSNVCLLENIVNGSLTNIDTFNANTNYLFTNGSLLISGGGLNVGATLTIAHTRYGCATFGSATNDAGFESLQGNIGEVLLFNRTLRRSEIEQIEGYLAWKWGIQRSLPVTHPYYNNVYLPNSYPITYYPTRLNPTTVVPTVPGFTIPLIIRQFIWQPTGMALWLDASDKTTITPSTGGTISSWLDKSGNAKNPTFVGTTTYNPTTNAVFTTGSSYFFSAVDTRKTTVANITLFLVHRQTNNTSPTNQGLWGNDIGGGWNRFQLLNFAFTPAQTYSISAGATGGVGVFNSVPNLNSLNRLLYTCGYSINAANGSFVNINGTNSVRFTENPALTQTATQNTYFGTIDTGINAAVEFYEIILYTTSLSTQQRQQIEGYLAWKWDLQKSLPTSHPFYLFPPS